MSVYITKTYWILDKDNNVILGNDDNIGIPATEINECDAYARESDSTELLDYIPYNLFFLLDDKNNVILQNDDTGIILNYGESLSDNDYTAFAVYSDTDNSLIFYYDIQPSVGDTYNRRVVTEIYTGWDEDVYDYWEDAPWYSRIPSLKSVSFDRTFANNVYPKSIAFWFVNFTDDIDLNLDNLDTRYTENMRGLFNSSSKLTSIDLSGFDTSCVTDMSYMFSGSSDLKTINVSSFNTSNVTNMEYMFDSCNSLEVLDLRSFDTTNVTSYRYFATECDNLQEILISSSFDLFVKSTEALVTQQYWKDSDNNILPDYLIGVQGDTDCFIRQPIPVFAIYSEDDSSLTFYSDYTVPSSGSSYNGKTVTNVYTGFDEETYSSSSSVPWYSERTSFTSVVFDKSFVDVKPIAAAYWFYGFTNCEEFNGLENLNTSNVTTMLYMFAYCSSLTEFDVSSFNVTNVTTMESMFSRCDSLSKLNMSGLNTTKVTNLRNMFSYCTSLTSLNISNFNTINVTDMSNMFNNCISLTSLNMTNFDTASVTNIFYMFHSCSSLTSLDVSNFDTAKVTDMSNMFDNCTSLTTIYSNDNNFVTTSVTSGDNMFTSCSKLVGGNGTTYSSSNTDYTMAHVDTASNPGYFTAK